MKQIRGKRALVTGAASGIGRAIALRLADEGANLVLVDINEAGLEAVVAEARQRGVEAVGRRCDLTQPTQISAVTWEVLRTYRGVDILVNNAGITYYGRTPNMSAENWRRILAVNLHAPLQFTRELLPRMLKRGDAHVLNVASICGLVGLARVAAYTTTKFALVGFSESLRHECGRAGLGVTALCPGLVDTNLFAAAPLGRDVRAQKQPPRWVMCTPEKVADRAIRAIYRNQGVVVMQPMSRLLYWAKRFVPGLLDLAHHIRRRKQGPTTRELRRQEAAAERQRRLPREAAATEQRAA
ncbi:MAG TPA: SDR family NAD(P)-dependent oxidoreductase [Lacipirellulaceae bacterium]|nr:SDR family NAD(P)-dependent oxidoreductase [Lacipirellulaceae bacterium]